MLCSQLSLTGDNTRTRITTSDAVSSQGQQPVAGQLHAAYNRKSQSLLQAHALLVKAACGALYAA